MLSLDDRARMRAALAFDIVLFAEDAPILEKRYVLNRQTATNQMWFAAGASAWHFAFDAAGERGVAGGGVGGAPTRGTAERSSDPAVVSTPGTTSKASPAP